MVTHSIKEAVLMADRIVIMEKDPGRVVRDMKVPLSHPRIRKDAKFLEVVDRVYAILAGQTQSEHLELGTAPGEPGGTRALPHIAFNELADLLENVSALPNNRADIYRLAEELRVNSDHLLRLTDAAELLGFVNITQGDLILTFPGETFAHAGILTRKEIFAARIRRLPIFKWLLSILQALENKRLEWEVIKKALELEFPAEEAERQVDTAVNWGRYAEILAYEDNTGTIYLEVGEGIPSTLPQRGAL